MEKFRDMVEIILWRSLELWHRLYCEEVQSFGSEVLADGGQDA